MWYAIFSKLNLISRKTTKRTLSLPNFKLWFKLFPLREDRICVRYLQLTIHVTNYESPRMFPNVTRWAQKLIRLTEDSHSIFFDPRFLSYSALKKIYLFWSISLREICDKFSHNFDVAGKSSANETWELLYLNRKKVWNFDLTQGATYFGLTKRCICSTSSEKWRILLHLQEFPDSNFKVQIDHR